MQLKQILKVTLNLIQLRTLGDIVTTTDFRFNRDIYLTLISNRKIVIFNLSLVRYFDTRTSKQ